MVAGCNGAGKSSFSKALFDYQLTPFDYDQYFLEYYYKLQPTDVQDRMAHNLAFQELERQIESAIKEKYDFAYETNFNSTPLFWPEKFKKVGYKIHLIYFVLDSLEEAKRRVTIRVANGGHFVPSPEIEKRYFEGFTNLNAHFTYFDSVDVFDCSAYKREPQFCFSLSKGKLLLKRNFPKFLLPLIPDIAAIVA